MKSGSTMRVISQKKTHSHMATHGELSKRVLDGKRRKRNDITLPWKKQKEQAPVGFKANLVKLADKIKRIGTKVMLIARIYANTESGRKVISTVKTILKIVATIAIASVIGKYTPLLGVLKSLVGVTMGLSKAALSSFGINNVTDLREVTASLVALAGAVGTFISMANRLRKKEQQFGADQYSYDRYYGY